MASSLCGACRFRILSPCSPVRCVRCSHGVRFHQNEDQFEDMCDLTTAAGPTSLTVLCPDREPTSLTLLFPARQLTALNVEIKTASRRRRAGGDGAPDGGMADHNNGRPISAGIRNNNDSNNSFPSPHERVSPFGNAVPKDMLANHNRAPARRIGARPATAGAKRQSSGPVGKSRGG
eukprot:2645872-Rhodomonas_salina.1